MSKRHTRPPLSDPGTFWGIFVVLTIILVLLSSVLVPLRLLQDTDPKALEANSQQAYNTCMKASLDLAYYRSPVPRTGAEYAAGKQELDRKIKEAATPCAVTVAASIAQRLAGALFGAAVVLFAAVSSVLGVLKARPERLKNLALVHLLDRLQTLAALAALFMLGGCAIAFGATFRTGNGLANAVAPLMFTLAMLGVYLSCVVTAALVALLGQARRELNNEVVPLTDELDQDAELQPEVTASSGRR